MRAGVHAARVEHVGQRIVEVARLAIDLPGRARVAADVDDRAAGRARAVQALYPGLLVGVLAVVAQVDRALAALQ